MLLCRSKSLFLRAERKADHARAAKARAHSVTVLILACAMLLFWLCTYGLLSQSTFIKVTRAESAEPNATGAASSSILSDVIKSACELTYTGKFDAAGELIRQSNGTPKPQLGQLAQIVQQYEQIGQSRRSAQEAAYEEQLAELEKFQLAVNNLEPNDVNDVNDVRDINDVNDLSAALSIIARASEFVGEARRSELLSKPFVKQVFEKAVEKATELQLQGKWLDAYTNCYYWLRAADPNNKAYLDYAQELLDKASIVLSFEDSPCETREERYEGVKKEIFTYAIDALSVYYVSDIDYAQMAAKAIRRCELLGEVMAVLPKRQPVDEIDEDVFVPPSPNELAAWNATLSELSDEVNQSPTGFTKDTFLKVFNEVLELNKASTQFPRPILIAQFAEAALSALDPYTVIVWPRQVEDFEKVMTNEFTGIGIEISKPEGLLTVSSLLPDTPAYKAGLDAGDVIEKVDGIETKDMSLVCAVRKITGPKGTDVTLTIKRPGEEETKNITIVRDRIKVPTIRGWQRGEGGGWLYMIDQENKIGYVRITSFSGETASNLDDALKRLEKEGMDGLILDLRFNTGGLLESAVAVADLFIREGLIVKTQPGFGRIPSYEFARKRGTHPDYPLVILIDSSSASASEIVAGALADDEYERAVLVGERTHGKGSVQTVVHYPRGGAQLKYTMAHYHLPSGQRVKSRDEVEKQGRKDWGIAPDIEITLRSDELREMLAVQRDNDVLVQANLHEGDQSPERHTLQETLAADPQLAVALLVVRTKLIEAGALVSSAYTPLSKVYCCDEHGRHR